MADRLYLAAYVQTADDREAAKKALIDAVDYGDIVEGYGDDATLNALSARRIVVSVIEPSAPKPQVQEAAEAPAGVFEAEAAVVRRPAVTLGRSKRTDPLLRKVAERMQASVRKIEVPKTGLLGKIIRGCAVVPTTFGTLSMFTSNCMAVLSGKDEEEDVYRVTIRGSLSDAWLEKLRERGIEIVGYRRGAYEMFLTPAEVEWLRSDPSVSEVMRYDLLDTLHTTLLMQIEKRGDSKESEPQLFDLMLYRPRDRERVETVIRQLAGDDAIEESSEHAIRFRTSIDEPTLAALADLPWVRSLMPCQPATLFADHARAIVGLPPLPAPPQFRWNGEGEIVGVIDSGIDRDHLDLKDRLAAEPVAFEDCVVADTIGHGTHIAGIIAGTGEAAKKNGNPPICGIAPAAKLVIVGNVRPNGNPRIPLDVAPLFDLAVKRGATILNVSWGRQHTHGLYDATAVSTDLYIREHPEVLVVVAAGNDGAAPEGFCEFRNVLTPATAKNVITVGASLTSRNTFKKTWGQMLKEQFPVPTISDEPAVGNPDNVAAMSARGPTEFNSVKPDLVAPGTHILAPRATTVDPNLVWEAHTNNAYVYIGGTSMAAPVVAGCAALLRQYLRLERGVDHPSAALLKSLLITGAAPLPSSRSQDGEDQVGYPDFDQGFGRLDLRRLLPAADDPDPVQLAFVDVASSSDDALPNKKARSYSVRVEQNHPLHVTLVWTDPPDKDIQNQLTLDVIAPDGVVFVGNARHTHMKKKSIFQPKAVIFDPSNNVQHVRIDAASPGDYLVRVTGFVVRYPKQGFAVTVLGKLQQNTLLRLA